MTLRRIGGNGGCAFVAGEVKEVEEGDLKDIRHHLYVDDRRRVVEHVVDSCYGLTGKLGKAGVGHSLATENLLGDVPFRG